MKAITPSRQLALLSLGLCLAASLPSLADSAAPPVDVLMSLETPQAIVQGEPIVLSGEVSNTSDSQKLGVRMGTYGTDWYTLTLTDSAGKSAVVIPDSRPANPVGYSSTQSVFLGAGTHSDDDILVTRFFSVTHPGTYTLTAHVRLSYAPAPMSAEGLVDPYIAASGAVFTRDYVFPLTVLPVDQARLQKTADALLKAGIDKNAPPDSSTRRRLDLDALFSMPESAAGPSWEALAKISPSAAADGLLWVGSPGAADILGRASANPSLSPDERSAAGLALDKMYNGGGTALRAHIRDIGRSLGLTLPGTVEVPRVID